MPDDPPTSPAASADVAPGDATPSSGAVAPGLASIVDRAVADLAARLAVEPASIVTTSATAVTWPDRSIGCPKPGMNYAQVTVDGARVVLSASGATYDYHSGDDGTPFLCETTFAATSITRDSSSTG